MSLERLTKIDGGGISTTSDYRVGVITSSKFVGPFDGTAGNFSGIITASGANFSGNVTIGGTLTYEDVTNIDSVGIITAPAVDVDDFLDVGSNIKLGNAGVVTATTFKGDGDFVELDVDGHTNLDNVSVAGVSTFTGLIDAEGGITVDDYLELFHYSGTNFIRPNNGSLDIINPGGGPNIARFIPGNGVELWHTASKKFNTTSTGAVVTGILTVSQDLDVDGHTNLDNVSIAGVTTNTGILYANSSVRINTTDDQALRLNATDNGPIYMRFDRSGARKAWLGYGSATDSLSLRNEISDGDLYLSVTDGGSTKSAIHIDSSENAKVNIPQDLDVDGHTNLDNVSIAGVTTSGNINISSSGPRITFSDSNENPDFYIEVNASQFLIQDATNNAQRFRIQSNGTVDISGNANFDSGIDVTGGPITSTGIIETTGSELKITGAEPRLTFTDTDNNPDFQIWANAQRFSIYDNTNNATRLRINSGGEVLIGTETGTGNNLTVQDAGTSTTAGGNIVARFQSNGSGRDATIQLSDNVANSATISMLSSALILKQSGTQTVSITSGGDVGLGNNSPDCRLAVRDTAEFAAYDGTTPNSGNILLQLWNNPPNETANDHASMQFAVNGGSHNRVNTISAVAESAGNRKMAFTFCTDEAGSRTEKLRITGDGVISFDQGTTAAVTPSQTTASSVGTQNMTGGTAWFNHGSGTDYFGVDGDFKLTNGATYGKIVARNSNAAITNATEAGHTWFLVCKTVAGTLGNSNWVVEPVAGWKMAWPTSLSAGAIATFYMRDAVESFGSPTIPASGDYYIGWCYSTSQQMGTNGSSYFVDNATGGKIYYYSNEGDMSNPHQRIPRQGDSWDDTMTAEHIHFRFETLPKADLTGTVFASPLLVDPVIEGVPLVDGLPMAGGQLVKDVQWATNVSSVEFTNADFVNCNYLVTYSINGSDGSNNSSGWYQTRLQFCDHDGSFYNSTNDYISHCEWNSSNSTSPSINSSFAGYQRSIWLTGNGSDYDHEGYVWIIPSNFRHNRNATISQRWGNGTEYTSLTHPRIFVRGHAHLSAGTATTHYREEGGGTYRGTNGIFNISGFRLYGSANSNTHTPASNGSSNGYVRIWRFKSGFEAREVS